MILTGSAWISDRIQLRGPFVCLYATIGAIGYLYAHIRSPHLFPAGSLVLSILLIVHDNAHVRYFAVFCIVVGTYSVIGITISWCALP